MIDEFYWQFNLYSKINEGSYIAEQDKESLIIPDIKDKRIAVKNSLEDDVNILTDIYGEFFPSKIIEIDLNTACRILNRERRRIDAFSKLVKYLDKEYQTILKITSRKTR